MTASVLSSLESELKALVGILILVVTNYLIHYYKPYVLNKINYVENFSSYAAISTLYGGIFFLQREVQLNNNVLFFLFIVILVFNASFLIFWGYAFS